jgi:hypothetical protein
MSVTLETSHSEMSWSKADAFWNIFRMLVTSRRPIQRFRRVFNIASMLVTFDTSQAEMLALNPSFAENNAVMSVTLETSHVLMSPYVPVAPS